MGVDNVKTAMGTWRRLDDRAWRLLVHMAMVSMDQPTRDQPARRCWVGWETMSLWLGYDLPPAEATDTASVNGRNTAKVGTRLVVRRLRDAGAIKVVRGPGPGRKTEYELLL